jgi:site-specific recombinase XerC
MRQIELNLNAANTPERVLRAKRDGALVAVMVFGALRESEAAALLRPDIELGERKGRLLVRLGKGEKSRPIPLNGEARRWLAEWLKVCPTDQVFDLTTRAIQKRIALIGAQAAIEELTPHRLRHTCLKRMVDGGAQLTAAQKIAGHAKIETTARYAMAGWADLEEAVEGVILGKSKRGA